MRQEGQTGSLEGAIGAGEARTVEEENARALGPSANTQEGRAWKAFEILDGKQAGKSPAGEGAKSLASTAVNAVDRNGKRKTDYDIDDLPLVNLITFSRPKAMYI